MTIEYATEDQVRQRDGRFQRLTDGVDEVM